VRPRHSRSRVWHVLALLPPGRNTWETCTSFEVVIFTFAHYLRNHKGRIRESVVPPTLDSVPAYLACAFAAHGRDGPYCGSIGGSEIGDPIASPRVRDATEGLHKVAQAEGINEASAVHCKR
jgi:hypothetical protein